MHLLAPQVWQHIPRGMPEVDLVVGNLLRLLQGSLPEGQGRLLLGELVDILPCLCRIQQGWQQQQQQCHSRPFGVRVGCNPCPAPDHMLLEGHSWWPGHRSQAGLGCLTVPSCHYLVAPSLHCWAVPKMPQLLLGHNLLLGHIRLPGHNLLAVLGMP